MKKIPTLFQRNWDTDKRVRNEITPGAEWVTNGEGIATVMYDGIAYKIADNGTKAFKRSILQGGKLPPRDGEPADLFDMQTRTQPWWVQIEIENDHAFNTAFRSPYKWRGNGFTLRSLWLDGTYELCGPGIKGNPEGYPGPFLVPHPYATLIAFPREFNAIRDALSDLEWNHLGVVWHHQDGRMAKIKMTDFGIPRPVLSAW